MNNNVNYVLALDVSTSTIGYTIMDLSGRLHHIYYVNPPKTSKKNGEISIYDKVDYFVEQMQEFKDLNIKHIFVEEPLKNGPNINTTILLAKFNGMISHKMYEMFGVQPEHLSVHECRSLFFPEYISQKKVKGVIKNVLSFPKNVDKKKLVYDKVHWIEPHIQWPMKKNFSLKVESFDMADSYVVAKSGLLKSEYITKID